MPVTSPGLKGIVAASTRLSDVMGDEGILVYAGYNINELAGHVCYEEVVYLLWHDRLPNKAELDELITKHASNWRLERMAAVDRSILRLSVYELLHGQETPPNVVINEALEIARRFSGEGSVEFVNGILDSILKTLPARAKKSKS